MKGALARLRRTSAGARVGVVLATIVAVSVLGSALARDSRPVPARPPSDIAALLEGDGRIVVDREGRPVRGPDGKPLRVASDRRTLLDSSGRRLRDRAGRPLRIKPGGRLPGGVPRAGTRRPQSGRRGARRPAPRPGRATPKPVPSPDQRPIVLAGLYEDMESVRDAARIMAIETEPGDPRAQLEALEDHVNATGGIRGRRVVIRGVEFDPSLGQTHDELAAQQAQRLVAEERPLAVMAVYGRPTLLVPRLASQDVSLLSNWAWAQSRGFFARWPSHYFAISGVPLEVLAEPYVAALQRAGFFNGEKVGVLTWGSPWFQEGNGALRRALRRAGVKNFEEVAFTAESGGYDELARLSRDAADAVVRFQVRGVKRIVGFDQAGLALMLYTLAAESRGAKFVYGLNSTHAPERLAAQANRRGQLKGAVGVGWVPAFDVPRSEEPPSQMRDRCRSIYAAAGARTGDRGWFGEYTAFTFCEGVLAIREAIERSGSASTAGLRAGLETLGPRLDALNLTTLVGPDRHYGSAGLRALRYDRACTCFRYEGPLDGL